MANWIGTIIIIVFTVSVSIYASHLIGKLASIVESLIDISEAHDRRISKLEEKP